MTRSRRYRVLRPMIATGGVMAFALVLWTSASTEAEAAAGQASAATAAWERAIDAKGGRERLHAVRSVLRSSTSRWGIAGFNRITVSYERLLVLPSKLWSWIDERPTNFGLQLTITDVERDLFQLAAEGHQPNRPGPAAAPQIREIRNIQAYTFLETASQRPEILEVQARRAGFRRVSVIVARIAGERYEFHLDSKTMLPGKVVVGDGPITHVREFQLSDYRSVDGLQLPHRVTTKRGAAGPEATEGINYQLNVDYDPTIFTNPPSIARGPKGWQRPR